MPPNVGHIIKHSNSNHWIDGRINDLNTVSISCTHADSGASCTDADHVGHHAEHHVEHHAMGDPQFIR